MPMTDRDRQDRGRTTTKEIEALLGAGPNTTEAALLVLKKACHAMADVYDVPDYQHGTRMPTYESRIKAGIHLATATAYAGLRSMEGLERAAMDYRTGSERNAASAARIAKSMTRATWVIAIATVVYAAAFLCSLNPQRQPSNSTPNPKVASAPQAVK